MGSYEGERATASDRENAQEQNHTNIGHMRYSEILILISPLRLCWASAPQK